MIELMVSRFSINFFQNDILKNVKKIEKNHMDSEKSINSCGMKKGQIIL